MGGKPSVTEAESRIGFARAANVLERFQIAVIGEDPIARSVASRMWNIATATTDNSGMMLCDSEVPTDVDLVLEIASDELPPTPRHAPRLPSPSATTWPSASAPPMSPRSRSRLAFALSSRA